MKHISRLTILLSLFLFAAACSSDSSSNNSDSEQDIGHDVGNQDTAPSDTDQPDTKDNEDEDYDPDCHYDCTGGFYCEDGNVFRGGSGPLPCSEATEENLARCGNVPLAGTCEKGCVKNIDYDYSFDDPWNILCNEGRPLPTECTVTLELSDGLILAQTWPTPIDANSRPLICWTLPEGAAPALEDGWDLVVEREETASGELETAEWYATGVPAETRQIHYASCDQATDCSTAADLAPGNYFIHILEANQPTGYAASLVVTVE